MSDKTNYAQQQNLERNLGVTPVASRWIGLMTADGADGTAGTECVDATYARQPIAFAASTIEASDVKTSNSGAITFPAFTGSVTVAAWRIFDAVTAGNAYYHRALGTPQVINAGNQFSIAAGNVQISEL